MSYQKLNFDFCLFFHQNDCKNYKNIYFNLIVVRAIAIYVLKNMCTYFPDSIGQLVFEMRANLKNMVSRKTRLKFFVLLYRDSWNPLFFCCRKPLNVLQHFQLLHSSSSHLQLLVFKCNCILQMLLYK